VTGAAAGEHSANANSSLEQCPETLGTLAVHEDQTAPWWYDYYHRYPKLGSTVPVLRTMIQRVPALRSAFLDHALDDLHELTLDNYRLKWHTTAQRLAGYLLSLIKEPSVDPARFVLPYEKRLLAAKLGCTKESMSRLFDTLRPIGVTTRDKSVVVRSVSALREYAEARRDATKRWPRSGRPRKLAVADGEKGAPSPAPVAR